jgi:glutamyl-tRNA reductase
VAGKRVRTETAIARGTFSVGAAAVEFATQIFGDSLAGRTVLVLGAGKMSEVTTRHLAERGSPSVLVANRTFERAQQLAEQFGGCAHRYEDLPTVLAAADIVICSTAAPHPVVTRAMLKDVMRVRRNRELFLIDIAVPRDVEDSVADLDNVYVCNIDDLSQIVAGARESRAAEIDRARAIVDEGVAEYLRWWRSLEVAPLIVAVREKLAATRLAELARLRSRLQGLSDKEWRVIEAGFEALTNKIAHPASLAIKSHAQDSADPGYLDAIRNAFGLAQAEAVQAAEAPELAKPTEVET